MCKLFVSTFHLKIIFKKFVSKMQLWLKKPDFVETFDRVTEIHNLLFEMFADHTGSLSLLNYMSFVSCLMQLQF